ncbi:hypothetical protein [Bacillus cereus]|uniref:hypothetical protein n=1 Tax=Bacillus cereus TaxID=1396 RepID=UPI000BF2EB0D|nr:hypothetical protein [Bacillus cereus]PFI79103.1 hypothetical protein COI83_25340 [Bacillus cereus]
MQSHVVHSVGLIGNIIGFVYTSARYLGTGCGFTTSTWGISNELYRLIPMLLCATGILINGVFLSVQKNFKLLLLFTIISILNYCFLMLESINDTNKYNWLYEQKALLETPQICVAFLISSMLLMFSYQEQ